MLSIKENLLETIKGKNPDRFVNQFEFIQFVRNPHQARNPKCKRGEMNVKNLWGVTCSWRDDQPGSIPVHTPETVVIKDAEHWQDYVIAPRMDYNEDEWQPFAEEAKKIDRTEFFVAPSITPGIFEQMHYLMGMEEALCAFYEYPKEMHELIEYLTEWELRLAEGYCTYVKPDALFHHDDWGSAESTFFSPEMFAEFFEQPYKTLYGYYKNHGVDLVIHHSDSYAATLVPTMINMGIDIWQGVTTTNNIPELIKEYGGSISFMGGVNNLDVDIADWSNTNTYHNVNKIVQACGNKYFIPCNTLGGPSSCYPGVYEATSRAIEKINSGRTTIRVSLDAPCGGT